jgi:hypothetical protein
MLTDQIDAARRTFQQFRRLAKAPDKCFLDPITHFHFPSGNYG